MYIYEEFDYSLFESRFRDYNRMDQFTATGLRTLFEYLEEMAESTGEPIELDVVALCCEFAEDSLDTVLDEYGMESIDELQQSTFAMELDNGNVLYSSF